MIAAASRMLGPVLRFYLLCRPVALHWPAAVLAFVGPCNFVAGELH